MSENKKLKTKKKTTSKSKATSKKTTRKKISTVKKKTISRKKKTTSITKKKPTSKKSTTKKRSTNRKKIEPITDKDLDFAFVENDLDNILNPEMIQNIKEEKVTVLHSSRFTFYLGMLLGMLLLSASLVFSFSVAMYQSSDYLISKIVKENLVYDLLGMYK